VARDQQGAIEGAPARRAERLRAPAGTRPPLAASRCGAIARRTDAVSGSLVLCFGERNAAGSC